MRELRLIAELQPPVNHRSRTPRRRPWLHVVDSPEPRLASTTVLTRSELGCAVGPFPSRAALTQAQRAAESVLRLRHWSPGATRAVRSDDQ